LFEEDLHLYSFEAGAAEDPFARQSQIDELKADVTALNKGLTHLTELLLNRFPQSGRVTGLSGTLPDKQEDYWCDGPDTIWLLD
jgi:hypothetical protein